MQRVFAHEGWMYCERFEDSEVLQGYFGVRLRMTPRSLRSHKEEDSCCGKQLTRKASSEGPLAFVKSVIVT